MKFMSSALLALAAAVCAAPAGAQQYPSKIVRLLVSSPPGSAPDIMARSVADALGKGLGQTFIVENKPGAGGVIVMNALRSAAPDGYTIGLVQAAVATVTPLTYKTAKYDIETDYEAVGTVGVTPMMFTASTKFPAKTLAEAIAAAKANPAGVAIGNPTRTSIPHLASELLAAKSGAKFQQVPFSSTPQGIQSVVPGEIQMYTDGVAPLIALVKSGKLKALAVAADSVLPGLEGIPLAKDTVPGLVVYGWFTLHAPKGTPSYILQKLNSELNLALRKPELVARFHELGTYPRISSLAETRTFLGNEKHMFGSVVKSMGLQPE